MASDRRSSRRWASACLALTLAWSVPGVAEAAPKPTRAEAQKKLDQLNEKVEKLVDKYNQANGELKIARRKLDSAKKAADRENDLFDQARLGVVQMAANAYKTGEVNEMTSLLSADDPQAMLDNVSLFSQVAQSRGDKIQAFLYSAQRLERRKGNAQDAYDKVNKTVKELKGQKSEIDKSIDKQLKLVRSLGGGTTAASGPIGGTYTGPATGSAKAALDYAYAQLGKPYIYGGEGPNGYDCSGLTMMSWRKGGVSLPRTASSQYSATSAHRVSFANLQPGDLMFFSGLGHVGMYVGGGKMIHAPRTGKNVEIVSVTSGYYKERFVGGGRP